MITDRQVSAVGAIERAVDHLNALLATAPKDLPVVVKAVNVARLGEKMAKFQVRVEFFVNDRSHNG